MLTQNSKIDLQVNKIFVCHTIKGIECRVLNDWYNLPVLDIGIVKGAYA